MLPTFVIGLREGLEASLIVGIVAAFLRQRERRDLLRWVWIGVISAALLCLAGGIALRVVSQNLPQRQQEGLETVIGAVAVVMVTYMVVWMRRNSRSLKGQLEGAAAEALAAGSGWALVAMAFLAVLREGFETSVFLLAAYNESDNGTTASIGAVLGIAVAVGIGFGIYRGGVKLNLSKFFRATGVLLVLIAAGLVVSALHTAHEAGWLNVGQQQLLDLSALVKPGTVQESLLTGMLGIQARPVVIEVLGWLAFLIPVGLYVGWPAGRSLKNRTVVRLGGAVAGVAAVAAILLAVLAPAQPSAPSPAGPVNTATVASVGADQSAYTVILSSSGAPRSIEGTASRSGDEVHDGVHTETYTASVPGATATNRPSSLSYGEIAASNGGSLPFGVRAKAGTVPVSYASVAKVTIWVEPRTSRVVDVRLSEKVTTTATFSVGVVVLSPAQVTNTNWPASVAAQQSAAARDAVSDLDARRLLRQLAVAAVVVTALSAGVAAWFLARTRRRSDHGRSSVSNPKPELVRS